MEKLIRQPGLAGQYYAKLKNNLEREVAVFLENSNALKIPNRVMGLIVPNDPYTKSGGVAARAFRQILEQDVDFVVVLTSSYHTYFEEVSIFSGDAFSTPLGECKVDKELAGQISDTHKNLILSTLGHEVDEHGIEVQLPFLQHVLSDFKLIPIVMGNQDTENINILVNTLTSVFKDKKVLFVASSNLSSGYSYDKASLLDKVTISEIEEFNPDKLEDDFQNGVLEMSSGGAVITAMKVCKNFGADKSKVLLYRNSGDMSSSKDQVVGYVSALLYS